MYKTVKYFMFFCLFLMAVSCGHRKEHQLLLRAEQFLFNNPDSAECYLDSIGNWHQLEKSDRALYGLIRTMTNDLQGRDLSNDSLIRTAYDYFRAVSKDGYSSDSLLLRRYGRSCFYLSNYAENIDSLNQAERLRRIAIHVSTATHDWHLCYLAYIYLALQKRLDNVTEAIRLALKSKETYDMIRDNPRNEVILLINIGKIYTAALDTANSEKYLGQALRLAEKQHMYDLKKETFMALAVAYMSSGRSSEALRYAKIGCSEPDSAHQSSAMLTLAYCYMQCDSLRMAKQLFESIPCDSDVTMKCIISRRLAHISMKLHAVDSAMEYYDSAFHFSEQMYMESLASHDAYAKESFHKEHLHELQRQKGQRLSRLVVGGATVIIMIALFVFFYYRKRLELEELRHLNFSLQTQHERDLLLQKQKEQSLIIEENEKEFELQKQVLHQRNLKLSLMQLHFLQSLELMKSQKIANMTYDMSEAEWKQVENLLNDTDENFVQNLRASHPEFSEEDIQLCILMRMKIPNAVIGRIYNIGLSAVKKRKSNLKKQGFGMSETNVTLDDIIERM